MEGEIMQTKYTYYSASRFLVRKEHFGVLIFDRQYFKQYSLSPSALDLLRSLLHVPKKHILEFLRNIDVDNLASYEKALYKLEQMGILEDQKATFDFVDCDSSDLGGALVAPIRVFLNLNENCNYSCRHCCVRASNDLPSFSKEKALALCLEMADMGVIEIAIVGGEPFMYPYLFEFLEFASGLSFSLTITTNGSLVNKNIAGRLAILGKTIRYIHVSVDGPEDINDYIRGEGAFRRAVSALRLLSEAGIESTAQVTMTKLLLGRERDLVHELSHAGISRLCISGLRPTGRALDNDELLLQWYEERVIQKRINDLAAEAGIVVFSSELGEADTNVWDHIPAELCGAGWLVISISADGNVYPCTFMKDYYARVGLRPDSVYERSLKDIWHNGELFSYTRENRICFPCTQCVKYGTSCPGQCPAVYIERYDPKYTGRLICPLAKFEIRAKNK